MRAEAPRNLEQGFIRVSSPATGFDELYMPNGLKSLNAVAVTLCLLLLLAGCGGRPGAADYPGAKWCPRSADGGMEKGRAGKQIDLVVLYTTEHPAVYARKLWRESASLSGHYIVTGKGKIWQMLSDSDAGWHAGNREFNLRSIAIAVEGYADSQNPQNPTKDPWQTTEELESLVRLISWLCERYGIPMDRAHIIGKNQVPGVRTESFPLSGPQYWGGAGNKSSPGASWDWGRLMEKLGRRPVWRSLSVVRNCPITTLPEAAAPVIVLASAGKELQAYDSCGGYWLVLVTEPGVPQPNLPSGRYHWDGWVDKRCVTELPTTVRRAGSQ